MGNQLVPYCLSINLVLENYKKGGEEGNIKFKILSLVRPKN